MKNIKGKNVIIISGEYKGAKGYVTTDFGNIVIVQPNELNVDRKPFFRKEVKVIKP